MDGAGGAYDVYELGRGKVNTIIVEHDDINLWDIGMMRFCCWRLFCGNLYRLGLCVMAVGRPTAEYPGYFGFSLGFNTPSLDSRMYRFWFM
jgi:DNA-directed RNA polymerase subunit N (RpoN/RPB10)